MSKWVFDVEHFLQTVTSQPGVYRMYDNDDKVIYVGKAKNLKKRLQSYFRTQQSIKTASLVKNIALIDVTVTHTETEALLLEHNYIKRYQPRYNVLLRDDKSYPYILLTDNQHPRLGLYRGSKRQQGEYFGPFPSAQAARETLLLLQKIFPIRQCEDSYYRNRTRPCLQYQIGRCLAPCVAGIVSDQEYLQQVDYVRLFLQGKSQQVLQSLVDRMQRASQQWQFEQAAKLRDQIQAVRHITEKQFVAGANKNIDAISILYQRHLACVHILFIRQGSVQGSRSYFPHIPANTSLDEIVDTFLGQFYLQGNQVRQIPNEILLDQPLATLAAFADLLTEKAGHSVKISHPLRGERAGYLKLAQTNANTALAAKLLEKSTLQQRFSELENVLKLPAIERMECFDISHTLGEQTVASCVVFDKQGPKRNEYRRYNISGITPGDDYAAMLQVLTRRYSKSLEADSVPDVIFIDGGKGQLKQAKQVFAQLVVDWDKTKPLLIGVSKGSDRKAGLESLHYADGQDFYLAADSAALHLIQYIRDESHQHAISGHRRKRQKVKNTSSLEHIEGIGPKRRQQLLKFMGGLQPLKQASVEEIAKVPGISWQLAEKIYHALKD